VSPPFSIICGNNRSKNESNIKETKLKGKERRQYTRAKIEWPVSIETERGTMDRAILSISPAGVFIPCWNPLDKYEVFELVIHAPDRSFKVKAEVVWTSKEDRSMEHTPRGMGIRFLHIPDEDRELIAKLVSRKLKSEKVPSEYLQILGT
jgi:hypothetical protein